MNDRCTLKLSRGAAWGVVLGMALALAAAPAGAQGDKGLGEYLSSECVTCHQLSGKDQPGIPTIIGMPQTRLAEALNEYKAKRRNNPVMQTIAGKFSNEEIAALAAYFGSLKLKR
jgi:cytochrome c553